MKNLEKYVNEICETIAECPTCYFHGDCSDCWLNSICCDKEALKRYLRLLDDKTGSKEEQIRILRKQRYRLLDEIHNKQQILDELDYMIMEIKKTK